MERPLFETNAAGRTGRRAITLPASLAVHAAVVAAVLTVPLLGENVLPEVAAAPRAFFVQPAVPPLAPPPPAAPAGRSRTAALAPRAAAPSTFVAPVNIPDDLPDDINFETGLTGGGPNGVEGGDPTMTGPAGAIVGGIPDAPTVTKPIPISGGIREPRKLRHVTPVYPPIAVSAGIQGTVVVECTIDANGRVVNANVVDGNPLLNQAAKEAVLQWVYTPTLLSGVPVPVLLRASVTFKLQR